MSPTESKNETLKESWKEQVKSHFNTISLPSEKKRALEHMLLNASTSPRISFAQNIRHLYYNKIKSYFTKNQKLFVSHAVTICATVVITLGLISISEGNKHDFIADMVSSLQDANAMPPDFDLVGDANALPELSMDSLPNQSFEPVIPKQLAQNYSAYEGRFFLYKGQQGVTITMEPNLPPTSKSSTKIPQSHPAVLYIVKLSQKNESSFPKQKVLKKIQSSPSKIKRIYAWRDGAYGYAMVQQQATIDNSNINFADNILPTDEQINNLGGN